MCWHANCAMGCLISFPDPCTRNGLNLSTLIYWIKALSGARIVVKEKEQNEKWDGLSGVARPVSFAECVDMRIGQWVVWFHLRTLCTRNGLDLSTLIHWISTGLGWDYSDSEILDTRPSVFLCQPFPLYQIRIFTNSDLRPLFCNLFLLLFLLFVFSNLMLAMSILEFFLSGGFICQVIMLCYGVLIVY